jgi:hypothetical protein
MRNSVIRRCGAAAAAVGLVVSGALAVTGPSADAAVTRPVLKLEQARATVTTESYENQVYLDLGVFVVAGNLPFEVRATRAGYDQPINAVRVQPGTDEPLPTGLVKDFYGLSDFFSFSMDDARGRRVVNQLVSFCPNGYQPVRRRPDAPASSPYPAGCAGNPYSTGAVWGVQKGYGASALDYLPLNLRPGTYTATVTITPAYRNFLHLRAADSSATVTVKVVAEPTEEGAARAARRPAARSQSSSPAPAATRPSGQAIQAAGPLPDLRSLPAWAITVDRGRYLDFAATVWNAGPTGLVVDGFRRDNDEDLMDAYQYFYDSAGQQIGYEQVGTMEWDERDGHTHWHFTDFASYRLLNANKQLVVRSQKEAFCLANTDAVDYTLEGANWRPDNTELHSACGDQSSIAVREVLDAGSGDTYMQYLPGQSFDLQGLANGVYYIEVLANPESRLRESSMGNNSSLRKVTISGTAGKRKAVAEKVGIVVEPPLFDEMSAAH